MAHAGSPRSGIWIPPFCVPVKWEAVLSSDTYPLFINAMYGDLPNDWSPSLTGLPRLRFSTNALTGCVTVSGGQLDMVCKDKPDQVSAPLKLGLPCRQNLAGRLQCGLWSLRASLEGKGAPRGIYALDTGCCWGGQLTMLRWGRSLLFLAGVFAVRDEDDD